MTDRNPARDLDALRLAAPPAWAREMRDIVALELAMGTPLTAVAEAHSYTSPLELAAALRRHGQPEPADWLENAHRARMAGRPHPRWGA